MRLSLIKKFTISAGLILLGMATMLFIGNQGENIFQPTDPVFGISTRYLFWIFAAFEIVAGSICLFTKSTGFQCVSVLWLTSNLFLYRLGLLYFGAKTVSAYYDTMAYSFGISAGAMNLLLAMGVCYLWLGSVLSLLSLRKGTRAAEQQTAIAPGEADIVSS